MYSECHGERYDLIFMKENEKVINLLVGDELSGWVVYNTIV